MVLFCFRQEVFWCILCEKTLRKLKCDIYIWKLQYSWEISLIFFRHMCKICGALRTSFHFPKYFCNPKINRHRSHDTPLCIKWTLVHLFKRFYLFNLKWTASLILSLFLFLFYYIRQWPGFDTCFIQWKGKRTQFGRGQSRSVETPIGGNTPASAWNIEFDTRCSCRIEFN